MTTTVRHTLGQDRYEIHVDGHHARGYDTARFDDDLDEFALPCTAVRTARDPDAVLLDFLQRTYEAASIADGWDRAALERPSAEQS